MTKTILRYYTVFDREDVVNEKGVNLPTKFPIQQFDHSSEEVQQSLAIAKFNAIVDTYCKKYGITVETIRHGMEERYILGNSKRVTMCQSVRKRRNHYGTGILA